MQPIRPAKQEAPTHAIGARWAVSAVFLVFGSLVGSWLPHVPDIKRQIGCNDAEIGQAFLCSGLGAVISMQTLGSLIHRFGSRNIAIAGGIGACLLVPPLMLHTTIASLCVNLFCLGVCYGVLDVAMNAHAVEVQALHSRPIMASIHGWFSFGGIVGGATAALAVRTSVSPFAHLLATSAVLLLVLAVSRTLLLPSDTDRAVEGPRFVLPHGILLLLGILCAAAFIIEGGVLDWCALYVRDSLHAAPMYAGIATAVCSGSMACGRFMGDPILHRFGNRRVVGFGAVLCIIGVLGAVSTPWLWFSLVCFSFACFGLANIAPVIFNEGGNIPGFSTGVSVAAVTTCGYGGFLLGPPVIGLVAHDASLSVAIGSLSLLALGLALGAGKFSAR